MKLFKSARRVADIAAERRGCTQDAILRDQESPAAALQSVLNEEYDTLEILELLLPVFFQGNQSANCTGKPAMDYAEFRQAVIHQ